MWTGAGDWGSILLSAILSGLLRYMCLRVDVLVCAYGRMRGARV